jgi:hypothetical protein
VSWQRCPVAFFFFFFFFFFFARRRRRRRSSLGYLEARPRGAARASAKK